MLLVKFYELQVIKKESCIINLIKMKSYSSSLYLKNMLK